MENKKYLPISIVIPARNEEDNIRRLLKDIQRQKIGPYEVIIADANSTDSTRDVAKEYGAIVTKGGWPSYGRNSGAKISKQDTILFLDADAGMKSHTFLSDMDNTFLKSNLDCATCYFEPIDELKGFNTNLMAWTINRVFDISRLPLKMVKMGLGTVLIMKKSALLSVGGFREDMRYLEDSQFIQDLVNAGFKYGLLPLKIQLSLKSETNYNLKNKLYLVLAFVLGFFYFLLPFKKLKPKLYEKAKWFYLSAKETGTKC